MGVRDAIVLNTTGSNFEAIQTNDTVRIKGNNTELLSLRDDSGTAILKVDTTNTSVNVTGDITGSVNISGSASTASFGRFDGTLFVGDGNDATLRATLPRSAGTITGSAQMASDISGSHTKGFNYTGTIVGTQTCGGPGAWSKGPAVPHNTSRTHVATGDSPNAIITVTGTAADTWNGTAWSEITAAPNPTSYGMAAGAYDATIIVGGNRSGSISWNGSNWTEEASTNRAMTVLAAGAGTTEATLVFGGLSETSDVNSSANAQAETEAYDGSSWSECNDMLIARGQGFQTGIGTQNSTISFGGCGVPGATVNPPSPHSAITFSDPRSQGDHLEEWDGTNWTYRGEYYASPGLSYFVHSGAGVGTANASSFFGGYTRAYGGSGVNYSHYHWDGTAMSDGTSMLIPISYNKGAGQGGAGGAHANVGGYSTGPHAAPSNNLPGYFQLYEPTTTMISTGSFGRVEATSFAGDATDISSSLFLGTNALSSSARIADEISGSFTSGFAFTGTISGSIASSASFGRIEAGFFEGNANFISSSISVGDNIISQSAQIAQDISGSFDEGFEFTGTINGETITAGGAWSTGGDLIIPKHSGAMTGTQNAGLYVAGALSSGYGWYGSGNRTYTEEYNGTNWSAGTDFPLDSEGTNLFPLAPAGPDPAYKAGTGTQNAALVFGGRSHYSTPQSTGSAFEYDGTAYTQVAFMPENVERHIGAGTQNSTISYGGYKRGASPYPTVAVEYAHTWNGSTWSEITKMINARTSLASTPNGTVNSTMAMGAAGNSPDIKSTECWNGSSWSEIAEQNIRRVNLGGSGVPDDAQVFGGQPSAGSSGTAAGGTSEYWNGTVWVTGANMSRAQSSPGGDGANIRGAGSAASALAAGGYPGSGAYTGTEEYHGLSITTGSFGRLSASTISGDATNISASIFSGTTVASSSAQLATDISGSFDEGFEFTGTIAASQITVGGVWSVGGAMNNPTQFAAAAGTKNAVVSAGGKNIIYDDGACEAPTEEYNGTTWSNIAAMGDNKGRDRMAGTGTSEAAIFIGGYCDPFYRNRCETEKWNGSSWSEEADLILGRFGGHATGTSEAALFFGGGVPSVNNSKDETEAYDGSSWSECNDLISAGALYAGSFGASQNSAILAGGSPSEEAHNPYNSSDRTEEWNGTNWSEIADAGTLHYGQAGAGTVNDGQIFGGVFNFPGAPTNDYGVAAPAPSNTQTWDGTAWAQGSRLIVGRRYVGGDGGAQTAIAFGGSSASPSPMGSVNDSTCTEEYTGATIGTGSFGRLIATTLVGDGTSISSSLYAGSNALSSSVQIASDISGSFTSGFEFGMTALEQTSASFVGVSGSEFAYANHSATTMSISSTCGSDFDYRLADGLNQIRGTSYGTGVWSAGPNRNDDQSAFAAVGTQNAYLSAGGYKAPKNGTEKYDGTAWSLSANMSIENCTAVGFGTQNAAAIAGGYGDYDGTELYNGATYSDAGNMGKQRRYGASAGTQNAGLVFSGTSPSPAPNTDQADTETFDGNVWTEVNNMTIVRSLANSGGTQNSAIIAGGYVHSPGALRSCSEIWNGTNWSAISDMIQGKGTGAGIGTQNHFIVAGGNGPSIGARTVNTEEWNGTSWSEVNNLGTARNGLGGAAGGLGSAGIVAGGQIGSPTATNTVELWNATSTVTGSFGRVEADFITGDGSDLSDKLFIGTNLVSGSAQLATDISGSFDEGFEYEGTIQAIPAAWSTSGNINVARNSARMADASANAALMSGGRLAPQSSQCGFSCTEEYDGASWAAAGAMNILRMCHYSFGTQNAAVAALGISGSLSHPSSNNTTSYRSALSATEEYNGTTWAEVNNVINNTRGSQGQANGTQNAGIISNGYMGSPSALPDRDECTFTYNGTNWTQVACSPIRQYQAGSAGDASGMVMGGSALPHGAEGHSGFPAAYADARAQQYNCAGDAWSTLPNLPQTHNNSFGFGTTNNTYIGGGQNQPHVNWNVSYHGNCFHNWDGTSWSSCTQLPVGVTSADAAGLGSGIFAGGYQGPVHPGSSDGTALGSYSWTEFVASASFGRIQADKLAGDFSIMRGSVFSHLNAISGAAQIASDISGSFTGGFEYIGMISGSSISTGSFGRIDNICRPEQIFYTGDGSNLDTPVIAGAFSSSRQYDVAGSATGAHISGAFDTGFELFGTTSGSSGRNSHYVGVSGSAFAHAGNATTMSINSVCGSDFEFRLFDTVNQIKGMSFGTGVWSIGNVRPTTAPTGAVMGVQKAFLSAGGYAAAGTFADTYKYDGDSWAASATMGNNRVGLGSAGTQNAGLVFGGKNPSNPHNPAQDSEAYSPDHRFGMFTEHYNGAAWSEGERLPEGQIGWNQAGTGTQNAALQAFGYFQSPSPVAEVCHAVSNRYNGNTWSADADTVRWMRDSGFGGTQDAAIQAGGTTQESGYAASTCVQNYDGTSWSEGTVINTARIGGTFAGVQNAGIIYGANPYSPQGVCTEEWNGSAWTEVNNLNTGRAYMGCTGAGTSTAATANTGYGGSAACANTEFWDATATTTGSFGLITPKGDVKVESFHITGSTFNLPVFTDIQLEYSSSAYENQQNTGSLSGSVDRVAEVIVGQEAGEFYFHSDKNALAYTFASSSLISQSLSFGEFANISASGNYVSCSRGFFTQSFYDTAIITCYITGSQVGP